MIINLSEVKKNYKQGLKNIPVIENLNLQINKGESVAIVGQSGSGKTTLLSILSGLEKTDSGTVEVLNKDINSLNEHEMTHLRGKEMGIVFQNFYLVPYLTAFENICLPLQILKIDKYREKAAQALEAVQLSHRANHFYHELSGGEAQRVALARAVVHEPSLLFADEPSGNLDYETGNDVVNLLFENVKNLGTTLILVTHNMELAKRCQRVLKLTSGQLKVE